MGPYAVIPGFQLCCNEYPDFQSDLVNEASIPESVTTVLEVVPSKIVPELYKNIVS